MDAWGRWRNVVVVMLIGGTLRSTEDDCLLVNSRQNVRLKSDSTPGGYADSVATLSNF
jgi:hypothetical protein